MRRKGLALLIVGILMAISGSFLLVRLAMNADGQLLTALPLKRGFRQTSELVPVEQDPHYEVRFTFGLKAQGEEARFRIPVSYRIMDEKGAAILSEEALAASDSMRTWSMMSVSRGSPGEDSNAQAEFTFGTFAIAAPGKIRIEAELKSDDQSPAAPLVPELKIYHHVPDRPPPLGWEFFLFTGGGVLAVMGLLLFIVSFLVRKRTAAATAP